MNTTIQLSKSTHLKLKQAKRRYSAENEHDVTFNEYVKILLKKELENDFSTS